MFKTSELTNAVQRLTQVEAMNVEAEKANSRAIMSLAVSIAELARTIGQVILAPTNFKIKQISITSEGGISMAIKGVLPGAAGVFTATPKAPDGVTTVALPVGSSVPTWTSSDPTNAPVTASADGLTATVNVAADAVGGDFDLTVTATLPDGTTVITGTATVPILPPPPPPPPPAPASFEIDQQS